MSNIQAGMQRTNMPGPDLNTIGINKETIEKSYSLFRFGRTITETDIRKELNRNGLAKFLTHGLASEALRKGWKLLEKGTEEELPINDKFMELLEPLLPDIVKWVGLERAYGHSLGAIIDNKNNSLPLFRAFEPRAFKILSDEFANILKISAKEDVAGRDKTVPYSWEKPEELLNTFLSINRPASKRNSGDSYIIPIWDDINSVNLLSEHTAIFIIRTGAGRIIIAGPQQMLSDTETRNSIIGAAQEMNSANQLLMLPQPPSGDIPLEITLETVTGSYNVLEYRKLYMQNISTYTAVPILRLEGATSTYATAEEEGSNYLSVLEDIQKENMEEIRWISALLADKYLGFTGDFDIEFNVRQELTEEVQLDLLQKRVDILSSMMFNQGKLKINLETAQQIVGLEYDIDESIPDDAAVDAFGNPLDDEDDSDDKAKEDKKEDE